jgi:hypothetical protein
MKTKFLLVITLAGFLFSVGTAAMAQSTKEFYINEITGSDQNPGTKEQPLKTLNKAADLVNLANGKGAITVYLSEGIYGLDATAVFHPANWHFTKEQRLTIRAEFLPDDADWDSG